MILPPMSRDQVRRVDRIAMEDYGMPGVVLMENANEVILDIASRANTLSDLTAMGGGLESAIRALASGADRRHVLLFTDGMQNVYPKVREVEGHLEISGLGNPSANIAAGDPPTRLNADLGVQVDFLVLGRACAALGGEHLYRHRHQRGGVEFPGGGFTQVGATAGHQVVHQRLDRRAFLVGVGNFPCGAEHHHRAVVHR